MKSLSLILPLVALAAVAVMLLPGIGRAVADSVHNSLTGYMQRAGVMLMAEQTSREATRLASSTYGYKMRAGSAAGVSASVITGPTTVAWAQNDTCGNRDRIPAGSRMIGAFVSNGACGSSVTMNVGLRTWTPDGTGTAVDADGLVAALDVAAAQSTFSASGSMVAAGTDDGVTTVDTEPYFTLLAANPTDDADIRVTVLFVKP